MDELNRLSSHLLFWSCLCMDMGALTAFFYGFRDREKVLDIMEETTGGRLIQNYNVIGGVMADIHPNLINRIKEFIKYLPPMIKEYHDVFTGNVIAQQRFERRGHSQERGRHQLRGIRPDGTRLRVVMVTCVNTRRTGYMTRWISRKSSTRKETRLPVTWCAWKRFSNHYIYWNNW